MMTHWNGFKTKLAIGALASLIPSQAMACEVGATLFKDTAYGIGGGVVIGGLLMIAQEEDSRIAANLATSALVGAGVGATVGIVEVAMGNCGRGLREADAGLKFRPFFKNFAQRNEEPERGYGVKVDYRLKPR